MAKKYICKVCGYVHTGDKAPAVCPQCQQKDCFEPEKKGLDTNSNVYTIVYATIVVIIVAVLLALTNQALKPKQDANVKLDQQKQMLVALNQELGADPAALYESLVRDTIDSENAKPGIFRFEVDGATKYVLRLHGAGLWGGIGGYIALDEDKNTIFGINFNHESETPGLGALIVEEPFRSQFIGKHIRNAEGEIVSVVVLKKGNKAENGEEQVDAVSGATITSTGVSDMLRANLAEYAEFLNQLNEEKEVEDVVTED